MSDELRTPEEHDGGSPADTDVNAEAAPDAVDGSQSESSESQSESAPETVAATETVAEADAVESSTEVDDAAPEADQESEDVQDDDEDDDQDVAPRGPIELIEEAVETEDELEMQWYILKVQVNRENSICDALKRRVAIEGLERYFGEILVPTEDVREFTKSGKQRIVKRKLYPGYIVVHMSINDDTWFLVRETPGIGDFTGAAGKPSPLDSREIEKILHTTKREEEVEGEAAPEIKTAIKFRAGDRVRVKEGYFQNFEGEVETIDESNGRITVMINIFGRPTPVELDHWQVEDV